MIIGYPIWGMDHKFPINLTIPTTIGSTSVLTESFDNLAFAWLLLSKVQIFYSYVI